MIAKIVVPRQICNRKVKLIRAFFRLADLAM
jgi:hypothetical protein